MISRRKLKRAILQRLPKGIEPGVEEKNFGSWDS
jgi:hypothetical protein